MPEENCKVCLCPLEGIIDIFAKKWVLLIINSIGNHGKLRYNDLRGELGCISTKTLSETLKDLQIEGVIMRESFAEVPPRVEYSLTHDGMELRKSIIPFLEWVAMREKIDRERCVSKKDVEEMKYEPKR